MGRLVPQRLHRARRHATSTGPRDTMLTDLILMALVFAAILAYVALNVVAVMLLGQVWTLMVKVVRHGHS
jgi:hypothetical protein